MKRIRIASMFILAGLAAYLGIRIHHPAAWVSIAMAAASGLMALLSSSFLWSVGSASILILTYSAWLLAQGPSVVRIDAAVLGLGCYVALELCSAPQGQVWPRLVAASCISTGFYLIRLLTAGHAMMAAPAAAAALLASSAIGLSLFFILKSAANTSRG